LFAVRLARYLGVGVVTAVAAASAGAGTAAWPPKAGPPEQVARQIAAHVASRYYVSEYGGRPVSVAASRPELKAEGATTALRAIVVRKRPRSNKGVAIHGTARTVLYTLCGSARGCSIPGAATNLRGRLIRRQALELALDTFTYSPSADSVLVFAPPAPDKTVTFVVYLRRADLAAELARPRSKTLPVDPPPFPGDRDAREAKTIDRLTLPHVYGWAVARLKTGGGAILLDPLPG